MILNLIQSLKYAVGLNVYCLTLYRSLHTLCNLMTFGLFNPYYSAIEIDNLEYVYYDHSFHFSGIMFSIVKSMYINSYSNIGLEIKAHSLAFMNSSYHTSDFNCNPF